MVSIPKPYFGSRNKYPALKCMRAKSIHKEVRHFEKKFSGDRNNNTRKSLVLV